MRSVINIYKPQGMTPLEVVRYLQKEHPEYKGEKLTYAGRLDPMAEGVLIVLGGDAIREKESYLGMDKTYEADIILGIGTDTHDILGMVTDIKAEHSMEKEIANAVKDMEGVFAYPFPAYSSKPIKGKPLFQWAREGKLREISIPKRTMHVEKAELLRVDELNIKELMRVVEESIKKVQGDFRQDEIINKWHECIEQMSEHKVIQRICVRINCGSGTYVRTLAHELGKRLGADACVLRLIRTHVGIFDQKDSLRIKE